MRPFLSESFSINAVTGIVSITNTETLEPGVYKLTISCLAGGACYTFRRHLHGADVARNARGVDGQRP